MRVLLGWMQSAATRSPARVLGVLAAATVVLAALASTNVVEVDLAQLGSDDSHAVQAINRVRNEFADPTASLQVLVDTGADGNVLSREGFAAIEAVESAALEVLGPAVRTDDAGQPQLLSLRSGVGGVLAQQGADLRQLDDATLGSVAARAAVANPQLAALVSDDLDVASGSARGTAVLVLLDPALTETQRTDAAQRVADALDDPDVAGLAGDIEVTVFSNGLFVTGLIQAIRAEVPVLFGLALLVVLTILGFAYRSVSDVVVGLIGLLATVVWTFGLVALLGPANLGWTGPLTQLAVIVPVLLVGLGIDYSVHLTARYREERAAGQAPAAAADRALATVGTTLVLATAATALGFASIATAPVQMLADFGVFLALGVVCAFVLMGLLVPGASVLRDRRRAGVARSQVRELDLGRLLGGPTWLARRRPLTGMAVAGLLMAASLVAATALEIEFERGDFVPEGSEVAAVLAHQEELFGGGVTESTFVLVDGDLAEVEVANAVWAAQRDVADVDGVRSVGGAPQVLSIMTMAAAALDPAGGPLPGGTPAEADPGPGGPAVWTDDGFAADADLDAVYALLRDRVGEQRVARLLAPDNAAAVIQIRTVVGDSGAERVQREIAAAFAPVETAGAVVTVTSEPIIIAEMSDELSAFQLRAIALTLVVVLALLAAYYAVARRQPLLGVIAMIPATVSASLVLGTMWALGIAFNVLTATLTAIAVGIGVPYGVHVVNRFAEAREHADADTAIATTLRSTGAALAGSALTTLGAFVVLTFSGLPPIRSLGLLGGAGIVFALLAAVLVQPGALVAWARRAASRHP